MTVAPKLLSDRGRPQPKPTLPQLVERLRTLFMREGLFQPADCDDFVQSEWEIRVKEGDPHNAAHWRLLYRYRRPDLCGIDVFDLSDVAAGSWRKPLVGTLQWSGRDFGIWGGGRDTLDKYLQQYLAPPPAPIPPPVPPIVRHGQILAEMRGLLSDADSARFAALAGELSRLLATMSADEKARLKRS